jgi:hypothetical protein
VVTTLFVDFPSEGGLAIDAAGNFYGVRDRAIYKVTPTGAQSLFAGRPGMLGFADGPAAEAQFARPWGLAFDAQGNLFVGDGPQITQECCFRHDNTYTYGNTIRKISPTGQVSTFAGARGRTYNYPSSTSIDLSGEYHSPKVLAVDNGRPRLRAGYAPGKHPPHRAAGAARHAVGARPDHGNGRDARGHGGFRAGGIAE